MKSAADDTCYCGVIGPWKLQQMLGGEPAGAGRDSQFGEVQSYIIGQRELHCCCVQSATISKIHDTMRAYGSVLMTLERFNLGKAGGMGGRGGQMLFVSPPTWPLPVSVTR